MNEIDHLLISEHAHKYIPNLKNFINYIFYSTNKDFYDFPLNADILLTNGIGIIDKQNTKEYLLNSKYKYENGYHFFNQTRSEFFSNINIDSNPVEYKLNKHLFRCDQFKTNHNKFHILFGGCSETFGESGPINESWSYRVYENIKQKKETSGYFNISSPGFTIFHIFHNIKIYTKLYGKPDLIVLFLPSLLRYFEYINKNDIYQIKYVYMPEKKNKKIFTEYANHFIYSVFMINDFLNYCKNLDIKIIWSTWSSEDMRNFNNIELFSDSFLNIPTMLKLHLETTNPDQFDILRRDGIHRGNVFHKNIANEFIKKINESL